MIAKIFQNDYVKNCFLLVTLFLVTLALNFQIISYNMMYVEQPLIYVANTHIHHFADVIYQYLHPKFLQYAVTFFRPSGHFLMYYFLAPLLGWHNTQGFLAVNLLFLALSGLLIVKIYQRLFPGYLMGGLIAYAIYLMHPAMMLSRLSIMHFEYAYIFFMLASLYVFILFTEKNQNEKTLSHFGYFIVSLLLFVIAVTFKEVALMIGPMLFIYFCIMRDKTSYRNFIVNREIQMLLLTITLVSVLLFFYVTAPWPGLFHHPYLTEEYVFNSRTTSFEECFKIIFGFKNHHVSFYKYVVYPWTAKVVMFAGFFATIYLFISRSLSEANMKNILFLCCAFVLFLVLPTAWGVLPWHLSPSILFLSVLFGFAFEKLLSKELKGGWLQTALIAMAVGIALITPATNAKYIHRMEHKISFFQHLMRNAIFAPPLMKSQLKPDSIIVVEDNYKVKYAYLLGDSAYPLMMYKELDRVSAPRVNDLNNFMSLQPLYSGNLFQYAYLMPGLREEEYLFSVDDLRAIPDEILHNWVQNYNNIFCVGFDDKGHWLDKTAIFKKNVMAEQQRRHLVANQYQEIPHTYRKLHPIGKAIISVEDAQICQTQCDKQSNCKGFVMLGGDVGTGENPQCYLYSNVIGKNKPCPLCNFFIKELN